MATQPGPDNFKLLRVIHNYGGNYEQYFTDSTLVTKAYTLQQQVEFRTNVDGSVDWKYRGEEDAEWKVLIDANSLPKFTWKQKDF